MNDYEMCKMDKTKVRYRKQLVQLLNLPNVNVLTMNSIHLPLMWRETKINNKQNFYLELIQRLFCIRIDDASNFILRHSTIKKKRKKKSERANFYCLLLLYWSMRRTHTCNIAFSLADTTCLWLKSRISWLKERSKFWKSLFTFELFVCTKSLLNQVRRLISNMFVNLRYSFVLIH